MRVNHICYYCGINLCTGGECVGSPHVLGVCFLMSGVSDHRKARGYELSERSHEELLQRSEAMTRRWNVRSILSAELVCNQDITGRWYPAYSIHFGCRTHGWAREFECEVEHVGYCKAVVMCSVLDIIKKLHISLLYEMKLLSACTTCSIWLCGLGNDSSMV